MYGLRVIIIGSKNHITKNNLNGLIPEIDWAVCYSSEDVLNFLNKENSKVPYDIEKFFNPTNKSSVRDFLN